MGIDTSKNRNSARIGLAEQLQANYNKTVEPKIEKMVSIREDKNQQHKRELPTKLPDININRGKGVAQSQLLSPPTKTGSPSKNNRDKGDVSKG